MNFVTIRAIRVTDSYSEPPAQVSKKFLCARNARRAIGVAKF